MEVAAAKDQAWRRGQPGANQILKGGDYDRSLFHVSVLERCREGALSALCYGRGALERTGRLPGDSGLYGQFNCGPLASLANHYSIYGGVVSARRGSACLYAPIFRRQDGRLSGPFIRTPHLSEYGGRGV